MSDTARSIAGPDPVGFADIPADASWRPVGIHDAAVMLDRIARFCELSCDPGPASCPGPACPLWHLERTAADYLERRWADSQD